MLKIAICDDEKEFCDSAERMLKLYMEDKDVPFQADVFNIPSELVDMTEKGTIYDVYLLDIYMPGVTGMSIATELRNRDIKSPIIFLTSSTDHALEAFGVDATHYLLKPYTKDSFYVGMDKAMQSIASHKNDSVILKVDNDYRSIPVSKLIYCEAEDKSLPQQQEQENFRVLREDTGEIEIIGVVDYICGVVAAEMPAEYETEVLKAQAVAAYTFACHRKAARQDKDYDVTDTVSDQAYISPDEQREKWGDGYDEYSNKIRTAVESVSGQALTFEGKTILAAYHSISGGKTEAAVNVWGDGYPYLQSVESVGDVLSPNYLNTYVFTEDEIKSKLNDKGVDFSGGADGWFKEKKTSDSGTVLSVKVCGTELTGKDIRKALGLKSANFDIAFADGKFTFTVRGYGHGMGMSQYGAQFMALQGSSYSEILNWYYPKAKLETVG